VPQVLDLTGNCLRARGLDALAKGLRGNRSVTARARAHARAHSCVEPLAAGSGRRARG
jgi:hypothetical protein